MARGTSVEVVRLKTAFLWCCALGPVPCGIELLFAAPEDPAASYETSFTSIARIAAASEVARRRV